MRYFKRTLFMCGVAAGAVAATAHAQTAATAGISTAVEEVVVTGSRLSQLGYQAPTPLTVVTGEQLSKGSPQDIPKALNTLPQFGGSITQVAQNVNSTTVGNHGNALNLRSLGVIRTLILLDGVRVPPSRYQGTVNVDILPEMLVKRVDVVTGGASAVYGSDAVSGVVNYVLDRNYTGVKVRAQAGESPRGYGKGYRVGVAAGQSFADGRGHALFSADHSQNDPVFRLSVDRNNWVRDLWAQAGSNLAAGAPRAGTAANPLVFVPNVVNNSRSALGHIISGPPGVLDTQITNDGRVIPYDKGINTGVGGQIGGSGNTSGPNQHVITGLITDQLFGQLSYDFSDRLRVTANGTYGRASANVKGSQGVFIGHPIFSGNAYLPAQIQQILTATNTASVQFSKGLEEMVPNIMPEVVDSWTGGLKVSGDISDTWKFQAYYQHGEADLTSLTIGTIDNQHLFAAMDAVRDPATGNIVCRVALTNPGLYPGCAPFNPFGLRAETDAALAYVQGVARYVAKNRTDDVLANISGELFSTWAGPIGVSAGVEFRRTSLQVISNSDPAIPTPITGLRGAPTTVGRYTNNTGTADATQNVKEAFGELSVPLAKDWVLAKSLDLSLAGRRTNYSTSGSVNTWKAGLSWRLIDDVRVRATRARDIRAPAIYEQFSSATNTRLTIFDPHVGTNFTPTVLGGGNPNLKPEIGNTKSIGVVLQPSFVPGFNLSVDYYDIQIKGAIANSPPANLLLACEAANGVGATCDLLSRPRPFSDRTNQNGIEIIRSVPINTAFLLNRGFDIEATYTVPLADLSIPGELTARALVNYVKRYATQSDTLSAVVELAGWTDSQASIGGGAVPKFRGLYSAEYGLGPWELYGQVRYIGRMKMGPSQVFAAGHIPAQAYVDATVTYETKMLGHDTELFFTVNNLVDQDWPLFPGPAANSTFPTITTLYDVMGRYVTAGFRTQF